MTYLMIIVVTALAQSPETTGLVEKARVQLSSASFNLADYAELLNSERSIPQTQLQEWLVIRGCYAWALAVRKPTQEQQVKAVDEAKQCMTRAKRMGRIEIQQVCPGDCWDSVPAAAKVFWSELPDPGVVESNRHQKQEEERKQEAKECKELKFEHDRLQNVDNQIKQATKELQDLSAVIYQKRDQLSQLDAQVKLKREGNDKLSAVLLYLENQIKEATAKLNGITNTAEPVAFLVLSTPLLDHITGASRHVLREGQILYIENIPIKLRGHHDGKDGATFVAGKQRFRLTLSQHIELKDRYYFRLIQYGLPKSSAEVEVGQIIR